MHLGKVGMFVSGKYSLYNVGGSFTQLGMVSNCTLFAKSIKLKLEEKLYEACFKPFTKLNSISAVRWYLYLIMIFKL